MQAEDEDDTMEDIKEHQAWERPAGVGMPGQLKTITLVNFMCHEHLKVDFGYILTPLNADLN